MEREDWSLQPKFVVFADSTLRSQNDFFSLYKQALTPPLLLSLSHGSIGGGTLGTSGFPRGERRDTQSGEVSRSHMPEPRIVLPRRRSQDSPPNRHASPQALAQRHSRQVPPRALPVAPSFDPFLLRFEVPSLQLAQPVLPSRRSYSAAETDSQ